MIVAGPGPTREERSFPDEEALQAFQIGLGERLSEAGWLLWGFDRDRRERNERRRMARPGAGRRS